MLYENPPVVDRFQCINIKIDCAINKVIHRLTDRLFCVRRLSHGANQPSYH